MTTYSLLHILFMFIKLLCMLPLGNSLKKKKNNFLKHFKTNIFLYTRLIILINLNISKVLPTKLKSNDTCILKSL